MEEKKNTEKTNAPDYRPYPAKEDIYNQQKEVPWDEVEQERKNDSNEQETSLEDFSAEIQNQIKTPDDDDWNTENFDTDHSGDDLDVPGSELDDIEEDIGSEDEENNYYSLGGPRKNS